MSHTTSHLAPVRGSVLAWSRAGALFGLMLALAGCGGGSNSPAGDVAAAAAAATAGPTAATAAALVANVTIQPSYHLAPVLPGDPDDVDRDGHSASAHRAPREVGIPASRQGASTKALTYQEVVEGASRAHAMSVGAAAATAATTVTYTPAQIRAAYGLPPVPIDLGNITALQAAQLGAGQTVYVIDAFHNPYAYGELLAFSSLFGLTPCTQKTLATTATLPLAAPASSGQTACEFYQVASGNAGSIAGTAPRYDPQWAIEIAMDIQWAHAIAPLARIVLIEAAADSMAGISDAIRLADAMGPGVVSMSFATAEGSFVAANDALFQVRGMSYFASTGDSGAAVNWPAVSSSVVAVSGTSLSYSGSGARSEKAWSLAGGGVSAAVAAPSYQNAALLHLAAGTRRSVADVAMNADPNTGQFVAVIPNPLTCTFCQVSWVTAGGTSLSTPQWAGLAAVANAMRALAGKGVLGAPHALLYQSLARPGAYAAAFLDVAQGNNGNCVTCTAKAGYDGPTGLGTPNGLSLVNLLAENTAAATSAPTVNPSTVKGAYGQPISFTPSVSSPDAYSLALSGAPAGMAVSGSVVNWPKPVTGTYAVKVSAKDLKTGLTGQGTITIVVAPPPPPFVSSASLTATVGKPLAFGVSAGDRYPCKLSLVGAPAGMTLAAGTMNNANVNWPNPVAGVYRFTVRADDAQTALSGQGSYTVAVSPASAPQVAAGNVAGSGGVPLSVKVGVVAANAYTLSLAGAPSGMTIAADGTLSWPSPVNGNYGVTVQARDSRTGIVGTGVINVAIGGNAGPQIMASVMSGVAGKPFAGTITITDAGAGLIGVAAGASNAGIQVTTQLGMNVTTVSWAAPVAGNYSVQISVTDSAGRSSMASIPLIISAK
ncbi:MAG: S53 family peptidase [Burkholderiales bacterium]|nr:S53 family peptidase [Burkholderiales bacterium]